MQFSVFFVAAASLAGLVSAQGTFTPARPPAIPLAVRSPYMNTWMFTGSDGGDGGNLAGRWSQHWAQTITAWAGLVRVDNATYEWMGFPSQRTSGIQTVNQTAFSYTATRSNFVLSAGPVELNVTFLSPVTPDDPMRQSLIASYMSVDVISTDGKSHHVQLYSDISAEWVSGNASATAQWSYGTTGYTSYHKVSRQTQLAFSEIGDRAEWGNWYYATDSAQGLSYQSGGDAAVRSQFATSGSLANTNDTKYRAINNDYPIMGFAKDLGSVGSTPVKTLFTIGLYQEQAIQFSSTSKTPSPVNSLWTAYFANEIDAVSFFQNDFHSSAMATEALDKKIQSDSVAKGGQDYATITTLSTRQAFGGIQLTGDATTQYIFLKEISSDGNVNTVDVIFPAIPIFAYLNATYIKLMLDPLFINQEAGLYPNTYSMHDLGSHYPNATGHSDGKDEYMPLEECGNMLIMTLAYAQRAKDVAYLSRHYKLLKQWTNYLVEEALYPANQISTDDFAGALPNQTNLAVKGIIGINAMAQIANLTKNGADATNFSSIAKDYSTKWQALAVDSAAKPPHTVLNYGNSSTWGTLYNLYHDKLLALNTIPQSVFDQQSTFYATVMNEYGMPLDFRNTLAKGDWEILAAAVASGDTQKKLISTEAQWISRTPTNLPLTDLYDTKSGNWPSDGNHFTARPVVGGTFALLALP